MRPRLISDFASPCRSPISFMIARHSCSNRSDFSGSPRIIEMAPRLPSERALPFLSSFKVNVRSACLYCPSATQSRPATCDAFPSSMYFSAEISTRSFFCSSSASLLASMATFTISATSFFSLRIWLNFPSRIIFSAKSCAYSFGSMP